MSTQCSEWDENEGWKGEKIVCVCVYVCVGKLLWCQW